MERLGGLDASFVFAETPAMHMHVCGLMVLDPATMPEGSDPLARVHAVLLSRLPRNPVLRQRLALVPFNLGRPFWVEDPQFDVERHLHRMELHDTDDRSLAEVVGEIASTPLERDRPLWEMWVVGGLPEGHIGLVGKMHHSIIDGITGASLMVSLLDTSPDAELAPPADGAAGGGDLGWPSGALLLQRTMCAAVREPLEVAKLLPTTAARVAGSLRRTAHRPGPRLFHAPRVSFNATVSARRAVAFTQVPLADVKAVKDAFGVTVNDVVGAVVGGGLRQYLADRAELPDEPLMMAEPVSAHNGSSALGGHTRLSVMFSTLATDVADPLERLEAVAAGNRTAKQGQDASHSLVQWLEHLWMGGFNLGARLYSGLHMSEHHPVLCNLIFSNVPGPPVPLYLAGARVVGAYPLGPVVDGVGLNVTVLSDEDRLGFGVVACSDLVPDVWSLAAAFPRALAELRALVPSGRSGGSRARGARRRPERGGDGVVDEAPDLPGPEEADVPARVRRQRRAVPVEPQAPRVAKGRHPVP